MRGLDIWSLRKSDLLQERQNKRRAMNSPEETPDGRRARTTAHSLIMGLSRKETAPSSPTGNVMSSSGLPISRKFNPPLLSSVRSKDRQPSQEIIDAMMQPAPMPVAQHIQPVTLHIQPVAQHIQPVALHIQPVAQHIQPVVQHIQPIAQQAQPAIQQTQQAQPQLHTLHFNRPSEYPRNIVRGGVGRQRCKPKGATPRKQQPAQEHASLT